MASVGVRDMEDLGSVEALLVIYLSRTPPVRLRRKKGKTMNKNDKTQAAAGSSEPACSARYIFGSEMNLISRIMQAIDKVYEDELCACDGLKVTICFRDDAPLGEIIFENYAVFKVIVPNAPPLSELTE